MKNSVVGGVRKIGENVKRFLSKKELGGKEIIVEVGLAVIAVALLLVFRKEINILVTTLITAATEKINALFTI